MRPEPTLQGAPGRGFKPTSRRRARVAAGAALAAAAVGGNVLVYSSLDDATEVVQVVRDVRAGQLITSADLRVVEIGADPSVPVVPADQIGLVVDQYARVHLAAGTLIVDVLVQPTPLVSPGASVVAIQLRGADLPFGLRERSRVQVVASAASGTAGAPLVAEGRVVAVSDPGAGPDDPVSVSIELTPTDAVSVAATDDVRLILLEPMADPALAEAG
jgi:hypothetical protein